jgi:hypothetical protein
MLHERIGSNDPQAAEQSLARRPGQITEAPHRRPFDHEAHDRSLYRYLRMKSNIS